MKLPEQPRLSIDHQRYYNYQEYSGLLHDLVKQYPQLIRLESLGKSHQDRDIWQVTLTDSATGPDKDKPAYYIDAQIHAEEHATSSTALYAINYLLERFGQDEEVTRLMQRMAFYIVPRINPDGAEISLGTPHRWCGNGRYELGQDEVTKGLYQWDVDDDGTILMMRLMDPNGEWKISSVDERVMVQREPHEEGGNYYRLYPEGLIPDFDGVEPDIESPRDGNLNRQFPANWSPHEYGAGEYPGSEPEAKAMIDFILAHKNICGMNSYHTHGGVILRPSAIKYDAEMSTPDITLFKDLGAVGTEITGYPVISIFEDFTPDKTKARHGSLTDWAYEQMGIPIFGTELWDIEREAGLEKTHWYGIRPRSEDEQIQILQWVEQNVGESGFRPWTPFVHPQLGEVEIGGMIDVWTFRNPPGALLEEMCFKNVLFCLAHAGASPRLELSDVQARALADGVYRVSAVVRNAGYLPTNLTDVAISEGFAQPVTVALEAESGEIQGQTTYILGHLAGRNGRNSAWSPWGPTWQRTGKPAEWTVTAPSGSTVWVTASSEKGGTVRQQIKLG
ncbi:peptidase M14 [Deinococcus detaillensis]|uniref:Peptidase M14 n=1 Tax=Deinococcus detaillensis TaxID=2592048 RepID=A0A553UNC6_9DEIO|nr:M14 family metallopeptidase [Deinococcus detaillensis]TSA81726.1 peptidase M14 [Deinococcus detaillensis]